MKYLLLIFLLVESLFSLSINESLLKIHAVLVPKIYLMDYDFKEKLKDNSITIAILYNSNSYRSAVLLKNEITLKYHNKIKSYKIKTILLPYNKVNNSYANLYYLLPTNIKNIKKVIKQAQKVKALTFSYSKDDLKSGIMLSLEVGKKVKPIINLHAVRSSDITFRPILLKISNIYTTNYDNLLKINNTYYSYIIYKENKS